MGAERYVAYVNGIADAMSSPAVLVTRSKFSSCIPRNVGEGEIANEVLVRIENEVEMVRKASPAMTVIAILSAIYRC
jgi:hypothetical protein